MRENDGNIIVVYLHVPSDRVERDETQSPDYK